MAGSSFVELLPLLPTIALENDRMSVPVVGGPLGDGSSPVHGAGQGKGVFATCVRLQLLLHCRQCFEKKMQLPSSAIVSQGSTFGFPHVASLSASWRDLERKLGGRR
jgi:hypothetical protein